MRRIAVVPTAIFFLTTVVAFAQPPTKISLIASAASNSTIVAPDSLVSIYGTMLRGSPAQQVTILVNSMFAATPIFASDSQINFAMPAGVPLGVVQVSIVAPEIILGTGTVEVRKVAPALFAAGSGGSGPAAALALRFTIPLPNPFVFPAFQCDASLNCTAVPLDVGVDQPLFLELFGTGIRGRSSDASVTATIGGKPVDVLYAGPQSQFPGLDQVNLGGLLGLRGSGVVDVVVSVDGQVANRVQVAFQ